jgi:hypothetical protein
MTSLLMIIRPFGWVLPLQWLQLVYLVEGAFLP